MFALRNTEVGKGGLGVEGDGGVWGQGRWQTRGVLTGGYQGGMWGLDGGGDGRKLGNLMGERGVLGWGNYGAGVQVGVGGAGGNNRRCQTMIESTSLLLLGLAGNKQHIDF